MAELEILIKLLASQLGDNINLRDALVETMFAFMEEEGQREDQQVSRLSYLELLKHIEQQQFQAEKDGKKKISSALYRLTGQIRDELRQATLALHNTLHSLQAEPDEKLVQQTGINVKNFPTGLPKDINLLKLSESYLDDTKDLHFLQTHFPGKLSEVVQKIEKNRQHAARLVQDVAWEALSTGLFTDTKLLNFHNECNKLIRSLQPAVKHELHEILREAKSLQSPELLHKIENWLHAFGSVAQQVLKDLSPKQKRFLLKLLIRTRDCIALEAIIALEPGHGEKDLFDTLMTLRFGEEFQNSGDTWPTWLKTKINEATQREQALSFWKEKHFYSIPAFLFENFEEYHPVEIHRKGHLEVPESLHARMLEQMGGTTLEELLENRGTMMTNTEMQVLEEALSVQQKEAEVVEEQPPESLEFKLEEVYEIEPGEEGQREQADISQIVEGTVETAMDYAVEGNLLESAIVTAIDRGSEAFDEQLTVTIEEEEEEKTQAEPAPPIYFKPALSPVLSEVEGGVEGELEGPAATEVEKVKKPAKKKPRTEEEPAESIWTNHIFPFIRENWVIAVGASLLFVGSLLLVFTMWDKTPLIRYGLAPCMIVGISFFLSFMGLWLKKQDIKTDAPIAIIQSVSIFFAPMSLLFVALLSVDSELPLLIRIPWGIILAVVLLAAWGYIFTLSIQTVHRSMAGIHGYTLLFLNALLLLLPVAQLTMASKDDTLNLGAKAILVFGFYTGFLILSWSMRKVMAQMMEKGKFGSNIPTIFYSVTCLGTFILVWGLTHARLMILPQPYTYGPLLLLFSFLISMIEFKLLEIRGKKDRTAHVPVLSEVEGTVGARITSLSYTAYFFIGLGVLLSISHDYVRVIALLMAGIVWFYQAFRLGDERHFNISMVILTGAFSTIALVRDFPAPFFPYLAIIVIFGLYVTSLTFPHEEVAILAARLSPIYMSFAFVVSILWQGSQNIPPLSYGFAFVIFGIFSIYLGAKTDKLIHVHAGAGYIVAALPYLGSVDMNLYTLKGNTLVFGLALVGILWTMISSGLQNPALKDSRSTVLWNIGILAFCFMCLRLIFKDTFDPSANPFLQFQILSGPVIIAGLMLLAGYFTRSYVAVYLALVILVIIFPEIKDRFNIPMYSGMGSTMSGIGFLTLAFLLGQWKGLQKERKPDLIWRKKLFPFQAGNHYLLFANPIVIAAFFLFTRTIFVTYPKNYFKPLMPFSIKTLIAVALSGTAYHFFSVWFRKTWFSYLGFIAVWFGVIHSCYIDTGSDVFDPLFLPVFILIAFLYCELTGVVSSKILTAEKAGLITGPFRHLKYLLIWVSGLGLYLFYSFYYVEFYPITFSYVWLPLLLYLFIVSGWFVWKATRVTTSWFFVLPAYLLLWQIVTLVTTGGDYLPYVLEPYSKFYLSTSLMVLGIVAAFFVFGHLVTKGKFLVLAPILWISFILLLGFSPLLTAAFYNVVPYEFSNLIPQIIVWILVSFVVGRFLNIGPLWLWGAFLLHLLVLRYFESEGLTRLYLSLHPFTLACIAIFWSALSIITAKVKWLYEHRYSYPWAQNRMLAPSFLFAVVAHLVVIFVFLQASLNTTYRHEWITVAGLFLAALPALFAAHQLGVSRHFLFGVPYTLAWIGLMFAVREQLPGNGWLHHLQTPQIISLGLFGALFTMSISDAILPCKDKAYRGFKFIVASGIILLVVFTYFAIRNIDRITWQWLATSGILSLGAGLYFRYLEEEPRKDAKKR